MRKVQTKKMALFGMLVALAFILSYVERLIPFQFGVPGIKLGLANIVVLIGLYTLGTKSAFSLSVIRVLLTGFTFGNMYMMWYSLAGAMLSFICMALLKRCKGFSIVGVSVAGGVAHNVGQIAVAMLVLGKSIMYYLAVLLVAGVVTGTLIGIIGASILKQVRKAFHSIIGE